MCEPNSKHFNLYYVEICVLGVISRKVTGLFTAYSRPFFGVFYSSSKLYILSLYDIKVPSIRKINDTRVFKLSSITTLSFITLGTRDKNSPNIIE